MPLACSVEVKTNTNDVCKLAFLALGSVLYKKKICNVCKREIALLLNRKEQNRRGIIIKKIK